MIRWLACIWYDMGVDVSPYTTRNSDDGAIDVTPYVVSTYDDTYPLPPNVTPYATRTYDDYCIS